MGSAERSRLSVRYAVLAVSLLLGMAVPSAAQAAQYYASPTGSGATCSQPSPCSLDTALAVRAQAGDEVILLSGQGTYTVGAASYNLPQNMTLHGEDGKPSPSVTANVSPGPFLPGGMGVTIRHLQIQNSGGSALVFASQVTVKDVVARTSASTYACNWLGDGTISDSLCQATGSSGSGAGTAGAFSGSVAAGLSNVTAIGPSHGVDFFTNVSSSAAVLVNVIARSTTSGNSDVEAGTGNGATLELTADHSNFASSHATGGGSVPAPGSGTNQTAAPLFVNPAGGDFHEAPFSPTIDAGTTSNLSGPTDFDGDPRNLGAAPDIGADEYVDVPPTAVSDQATVADGSAATPIDVLANDTDPDGGAKQVTSVTQPAHGSAAVTGSGAGVSYQPAAGFCGQDSFTYTLNGGSTATVSVTVTCAPPDTRLRRKPPKTTTKHRAKFKFASSEPGSTFSCKLDRKKFRPCTSPATFSVGVGRHTLKVRAIDKAGNADPTPAAYRWKVLPQHK
jgi:hypothetical protein